MVKSTTRKLAATGPVSVITNIYILYNCFFFLEDNRLLLIATWLMLSLVYVFEAFLLLDCEHYALRNACEILSLVCVDYLQRWSNCCGELQQMTAFSCILFVFCTLLSFSLPGPIAGCILISFALPAI